MIWMGDNIALAPGGNLERKKQEQIDFDIDRKDLHWLLQRAGFGL